MKKRIIALWLWIFLPDLAFAQISTALKQERLAFIAATRTIIIDSLKLKPARDFYTQHIEQDSLYHYVYVSSPDSVHKVSPGNFYYFGFDGDRARKRADSLMQTGNEVMLYQTAGTSASVITNHLLLYDPYSIAFIMMHEAMHVHLVHAGYRVPYAYEESIGDVVGNAYLKKCIPEANRKSLKRFVKCNEKVYRVINRCLAGKKSKYKSEKRIYKITGRLGTLFQQERYRYPVNNAYLLRFRDYTQHYFKLKKKFRKHDSLKESLHASLKAVQ